MRTKSPVAAKLKLRHPAWCRRAVFIINDGERRASVSPGSYIEIDREWRDGDTVRLELPMELRLEALPGAPDIAALMYGPIVLAGRMGIEGLAPGADIIVNERTSGDMLHIAMEPPRLALSAKTLRERVRRKTDDRLVFSVKAAQPDREVELIPYYRIAHERYNLYWQLA